MDTITRFPIYIIAILRHNVSIIYTDFLFRTHCQTEKGLWASVGSMQTQKSKREEEKEEKRKAETITANKPNRRSPLSLSVSHSLFLGGCVISTSSWHPPGDD